jgi:arsenate reductase-like glutaredoxin family protein
MAECDQITVYEKPTCTKCREMNRFLQDNGIDFSKVNYYIEPLTQEKLTELLAKMQMTPRDLLRNSLLSEATVDSPRRGRVSSRPLVVVL